VAGSGCAVSRRRRWFVSATLGRWHRGRWSGTAALRLVLGAPASSFWSTERERGEVRMSGRFRWAVGVPWRARGAFYRPERGSGSVTGGGGPGGGAPVKAGRSGFGDLLACAAIHCGVVMSVLACWTGQRRGREMGRKERGPVAFLLLSLGSHGRVRAGETGGRQRGERGCLRVRLGRTAVASATATQFF
jgi:hypothetical protein